MHKKEKLKNIIRWDNIHTIQNNTYCFLPGDHTPKKTAGEGILGGFQSILKTNGRLYYKLLNIFGPICLSLAYQKTVKEMLQEYGTEHIIINLGSGPSYFNDRKDIINIDIFALDEVDIVADAARLPIEDQSADFIVCIAMLEHVVDPKKVVEEMCRILKPGGKVLAYVPFIQPYHAAPYDFSRWNHQGLEQLFSVFNTKQVFIGSGPTSGLLYILEEWISILLSFGSRAMHDLCFLFLMVIFFPVKHLDRVLNRFKISENAASAFAIVAKK